MSDFNTRRGDKTFRADLPCMRCLQRATKDKASIALENLCVFKRGSACDYCVSRRQKDHCEPVPTMLRKEATEVLNLIDKISSGKASKDKREAAMEDVKNVGDSIRNAWSMLHKEIRSGAYPWDELQALGVNAYSKEMVEDFIEKAKIGDGGTGCQNDEGDDAVNGNNSNGHGSDDTPMKRKSMRSSSETTSLADAVFKMIEAVSSFNETVASMADAAVKPHEEIKALLEEVVQLQSETLQGQKDMLASQRELADEQRGFMNNAIDRMAKGNAVNKVTRNTQLASAQEPQGAESSAMESQTPNLADMVRMLRRSVPEAEESPLELRNNQVESADRSSTAGSSKKESVPPQSEQPSTSMKRKRMCGSSGWLFKPTSSKRHNSGKKRSPFHSAESSVSRKLKFSE